MDRAILDDSSVLPDGSRFPAWDDRTAYVRECHVAQRHPGADDANPGTPERPRRTIAGALADAGPRVRIVIHDGIYRECVRPLRGGDSAEAMLHLCAAPGARPVISGAEPWRGEAAGGDGLWRLPLHGLGLGMDNPFLAPLIGRPPWYGWQKRPLEEILRALMKRGCVWQGQGAEARRLVQVADLRQVRDRDGVYAVSDAGDHVAVRPFAGAGPDALELSVRAQGIAPLAEGLRFIRLSGLTVERCGNGIAPPLRGAIDVRGGSDWIIEDCEVRDVVGTGIVVGGEADWRAGPALGGWRAAAAARGGHIIRRNRIVRCGVSGIAGTGRTGGTLVEDNVVEDIGWLDLEHAFESAAIKFHFTDGLLIRRNRLRRLAGCAGVWLDVLCRNTRVHGNVIADVRTLIAGIYVEASFERNLVDRNLVVGIQDVPGNDPPKDGLPGGNGLSTDISECTVFVGNLVHGCAHAGIAVHLAQGGRVIEGRASLCIGHAVEGNLVSECTWRILLDRVAGNTVAGNAYTGRNAYLLREPGREVRLMREQWRDGLGFTADGPGLPLTVRIDHAAVPAMVELTATGTLPDAGPAAIAAADWERLRRDGRVRIAWTC